MRAIQEVAGDLGLGEADRRSAIPGVLKIPVESVVARRERPRGKLVLVTAMTPTPHGEGKTVVAIGLAMALHRLDGPSVVALRQPSLGPVFGVKGGAAGGGRATVEPYDQINRGLTGDLDAVTSAHNLLSAVIDNSIFHGNPLDLDPGRIGWPRALDVEDRSLRDVRTTSGKKGDSPEQRSRFVISAASEVMAVLGLSKDYVELKERLGRIEIGAHRDGRSARAEELGCVGSMAVLLRNALAPNLVQTAEGTPALVHGGPFANIAHGTASRLSIELGLATARYCVVEAGFSSELGAEKFVDLVGPTCGFAADAAVVVASIRALRHHGGVPTEQLDLPNASAVALGLPNLAQHIGNLRALGLDPVVAVNRFPSDTDQELAVLARFLESEKVAWAPTTGFRDGSSGAEALARAVVSNAGLNHSARPLYAPDDPIEKKIDTVARRLYGADGVEYTEGARATLDRLDAGPDPLGRICIAKTPLSLTDQPKLRNRPTGFRVRVDGISASFGAGFWVVHMGEVNTMPGLPTHPLAERIDLRADGSVVGLE